MAVARDGDFSGSYFQGGIDDIRIYNRALSTAEVQQLYQYESQPEQASVTLGQNVLNLSGNAYVTVPSAADLQPSNSVSIEAWIYPVLNTNNPNAFFISKGSGPTLDSPKTYELYWTPDDRAYFSFYAGQATWALLGAPAPDSQWTHIAATYDSVAGVYGFYTNGVMAASTTKDVTGQFSLQGQQLRQTTLPLVFGCSFNGAPVPGSFATGQMDEVRIWNRALSAQEIQQSVASRLSGQEPGLSGYWNFNDGTAGDVAGHGHGGVVGGQASIVPLGGFGILHNAVGFGPTAFDRRGQVVLSVLARGGVTVRIDACTNFVDWAPIASVPSGGGVIQFSDPDTLKFGRRFYRAVLP